MPDVVREFVSDCRVLVCKSLFTVYSDEVQQQQLCVTACATLVIKMRTELCTWGRGGAGVCMLLHYLYHNDCLKVVSNMSRFSFS